MTKEDKQLLIQDISARIPYGGVKGCIYDMIVTINSISTNGLISILECPNATMYEVQEFKPYLFPISSITKEQKDEYCEICYREWLDNEDMNINEELSILYKDVDWLNAHHFDYRGLIKKKLAIDATELNIY